MIGVVSGKVLFSDGNEAILFTNSGIGYQTYCRYILPEGEVATVFISHIIRENSEELYAFRSLREKKLFELIITVKGVGPKSAFNLVSSINVEEIIVAIQSDRKKTLTQVSGVGPKAASQMILDLQSKIQKVKMYSGEKVTTQDFDLDVEAPSGASFRDYATQDRDEDAESKEIAAMSSVSTQSILDDTLLACKNLGFSDASIIPLAQKILKENDIKRPEQLVHLVLKEV